MVTEAPSERGVREVLFSYSLRSLSHASRSSSSKNHPKSWDQTNRSFDPEAKARTVGTDRAMGSEIRCSASGARAKSPGPGPRAMEEEHRVPGITPQGQEPHKPPPSVPRSR